jgi:glycosidase
MTPSHPTLYEVNTRILLNELGPGTTLADVPDTVLDRWAALGFDWIWLLGVWQTGPAGREVSRSRADWRSDFVKVLPDVTDDDICGSPFAVQSYTVHRDFGGEAALASLRRRLAGRGLRLMLDFVPNHVALDHPWLFSHPSYFIRGTEADLAREPKNYVRVATAEGPEVLAHGRDPYFPGWPDTLQLNYRHPGLRDAMKGVLLSIAGRCDGVRCDMAMLVLPDVFASTWGDKSLPSDGALPANAPFWPEAVAHVRGEFPDFLFLAEAYWDLEWRLQQQGFDYTYDKRLYDRLRDCDASAVRGHLHADYDYQRRSARFLENHDEPRAAATFLPGVHRAAAVIAFFVPGMRFFHDGQLEGRWVHTSMHLARRLAEPVDPALRDFYERLLACLRRPEVREGRWRLCDCRQSWEGNSTWDAFLAFTWDGAEGRRLLVCVNYGPTQGQCYVTLPMPELRGKQVVLHDLLGTARYERSGDDFAENGLYLDLPAWGYYVFEMALET